jgi:predicted DCC family thiol-disulfide oxidoreductase YuxK
MPLDTKDTDGKKVSIYYDGDCAMCTALMCKIDASGKRQSFSPKDITKDPLPQNLSHAEAMKEIHVVDNDGKMYKNAEAILKILEQYPRWRWLVWIGRLPIVKQILPIGYNVIAANRQWLFGRVKR